MDHNTTTATKKEKNIKICMNTHMCIYETSRDKVLKYHPPATYNKTL